MKKIYIALAVLGTALLSSCVQEKSFKDTNISENDIVITLQGAPATRASEMGLVQKGVTIDLAASEDGHKIFLEETIEDLNSAWAPVTRGTPAYTENLGVLYKNNMGVYASALGDATYENMDTDVYARKEDHGTGEGWRYNHTYDSDPWVAGNHDFYFRMPATANGVTYPLTYGNSGDDLTITFTYTSPTKAEDQQDIIFAARNIDKEEYLASLPNGVPVLFNHALTGVKFALANPDEAMITSVEFTGLKGTGTCTITPSGETNNSDTDVHSSATAVNWGTPTVVTGAKYTATFDKVVNYNSGEFAKNGKYPDSFKGAGSAQTNNLNDEDATQTFWFIPQAMTEDVKLHIVYTYGEDEGEADIEFGKELLKKNANTYWYAGQLRTYTIRVDEVNVKIEDVVTTNNPDKQYTGSTKTDVVITNTGNTDAYIRAAIIGQWLNTEGNPVFGFTDFTAQSQSEQYQIVESWYEDQFSATGQHKHGAFKDLVGYKNDTEAGVPGTEVFSSDWWSKGSDGFYYFKYVVPAGKAIPEAGVKYIAVTASGTSEKTGGAPLFESYTIKDAPDARVSGSVQEIFFELEIATQAISAKKSDGTYYTLEEAWAKAGVTVTE